MPKTRRLLAVPFVGKDAPSPSSEFAHPDVAIGLTALAYRYEGLRTRDFGLVLDHLRATMDTTEEREIVPLLRAALGLPPA